MPRSNEKEKNSILLEKNVNVISAVNNQKLSPYLDIFRHYPENILLQNLGILTGFFRINNLGEESAYIVNFLSSVLKKDYYANPKRQIENSFDSALRKVNLALSEIAKEGNISWLGKIDGAVCVLEKNNLHFSVSGKAKVFLFRNQSLIEISRDMAQDEIAPNPLKTFVNVSSGRLEKEDKLIVCGDDVFKIFSQEEIKKGAKRFLREKFVQFLKTALINKLEIVGAVVIDIFEKEEKEPAAVEPHREINNAFSGKAFEGPQKTPETPSEVFRQQEEKSEYTDEKTGHIYIQEGSEEIKKKSLFGAYWLILGEKIADAYLWTKNKSKRRIILLFKSLSKAKNNLIASAKSTLAEKRRMRSENKERIEREKAIEKEKDITNKKAVADKEAEEKNKATEAKIISPEEIKTEIPVQPVYNEPFLARLAKRKEELARQEKMTPEEPPKEKFLSFKKIIPNFGKIKETYKSLTKKQKIYSAIIILLIFTVPFAFLKIQGALKLKQAPREAPQKTPDAREIFSQEKNIVFLDNLEKVADIQDPINLIALNEKIITASGEKITTRDTSGEMKEFSWPQNYGKPEFLAPMKDLNLALIYTDQNKIISFLSATSKFGENNISFPENSKISGTGTYLTYAYLLDSGNNQIYRYPRAQGGFGEKINWLKDNIDLSNACCLAIDENVYLINEGKVLKLFKGNNQNFSLEQTNISFIPSDIFTDSDIQNIYVLDKDNGRIIKFSKDGVLLGQYFNEDIKKSTGFTIDEKNNKAYLINSEGLFSFNLQ
ncbi:MAG: hypothetical protein V1804_04095 [Patescibacteria group bacterium]